MSRWKWSLATVTLTAGILLAVGSSLAAAPAGRRAHARTRQWTTHAKARFVPAHIGVLNRPRAAHAADLEASAAEIFQALPGGAAGRGFDLASARDVADFANGSHLLAVPGTGSRAGQTCVMALEPIQAGPGVPASLVGQDAASSACAPNATFNSDGVGEGLQSALVGLVPDGVSEVDVSLANGSVVTVPVQNNAYVLVGAVGVQSTSFTNPADSA